MNKAVTIAIFLISAYACAEGVNLNVHKRYEDACFFQCLSDPDLMCHDRCMGYVLVRANGVNPNEDDGVQRRYEDACFFQCLYDADPQCHDKCMGFIIIRQFLFGYDAECTPLCGDDEDCNIRCRNLDLGK